MNAADLPENPRRVKITVDVPIEEIDAFHAMVREFHCGTTKHHAELRQHAEDREQGATSLSHLYSIAQGSSGQCRFIARFLAGLYNGMRFPFDLTDFRGLDRELFEHCLAVLRLDYQPVKEVHRYFDDGQSVSSHHENRPRQGALIWPTSPPKLGFVAAIGATPMFG